MRRSYSRGGGDLFASQPNEYIEMLKAWGSVSLAFAIFMVGGNVLAWQLFLVYLLISAVTAGLGIVIHELAHRVVARRFGSEAHFVASEPSWLLLPIAVAFVGFFVAAPGAVWTSGQLGVRKHGIVALAGPVSNLVLAFIFLLLEPLLSPLGLWWEQAIGVGYSINAFLGLFNMIPVDPIDGAKVWRWDKVAFGVTVAVAIIMVFFL
jgi:Zn-dependent protease